MRFILFLSLLSIIWKIRADSLKDVQHVVFFMQENRAFDFYYGSLRGVRGFADPTSVHLPNGDPVWKQSANASYAQEPWHASTATTSATCADYGDMYYPLEWKIWNQGSVNCRLHCIPTDRLIVSCI